MSFFMIKMTFMSAKVIRNSYSVKRDRWSMCRFHLIHTFLCKCGGHGYEGWRGSGLEMCRGRQKASEFPPIISPGIFRTPMEKEGPYGWELYLWRRGEGAMMSTLSLPSPQFLKMQTVSYIDFIQKMKRGSPWKKARKGDQPHLQARTIITRAFRDS